MIELLNPYSTYLKIGVLGLLVLVLIAACTYVRSVFHDRDQLRTELARTASELATKRQQLLVMTDQINQIQKLYANIGEAVRNVKIKSNIYIDRVEAARLAHPGTDGTVLVPGGVPKTVPGDDTMSIFTAYSARRASTTAP